MLPIYSDSYMISYKEINIKLKLIKGIYMLEKEFFNRNTIDVAKDLLGKIIVHKRNDIIYKAKIVETEAYLGIEDRAAHTYNNNKTNRNKIMYMDGGTTYFYLTYGMHYMLNIVSRGLDYPEAVLIRAVEVLNEIDRISINRFGKVYDDLSNYQKRNLSNGPGKLTKALEIDKALNGKNVFSNEFYIEDNDEIFDIVVDKRIGIDYAKEAADYPYRFYIKDNPNISVFKKDESC